jgi:hypothetical protein
MEMNVEAWVVGLRGFADALEQYALQGGAVENIKEEPPKAKAKPKSTKPAKPEVVKTPPPVEEPAPEPAEEAEVEEKVYTPSDVSVLYQQLAQSKALDDEGMMGILHEAGISRLREGTPEQVTQVYHLLQERYG